MLETLFDDGAKVLKTAHEKACVDKVIVVFGDCPVVLLGIVDNKSNACGYVGGLDRGEIGGFDLSIGVRVTHLDCPSACACANIQDMVGLEEGCIVQDALQGKVENVVLIVKTLSFGGVVRVMVDYSKETIRARRQTESGRPRSVDSALLPAR
jgi:hypothetical protein